MGCRIVCGAQKSNTILIIMESWGRRELKRAAILFGVLLLLAIPAKIFFNHFPKFMSVMPKCPSFSILKFHCAGCGTTRALYCLFQGNIRGVFANNPIMPLALIVVILLLIKPELSYIYRRWVNGFAILIIVYMIVRNLPWYPFTLLVPSGI